MVRIEECSRGVFTEYYSEITGEEFGDGNPSRIYYKITGVDDTCIAVLSAEPAYLNTANIHNLCWSLDTMEVRRDKKYSSTGGTILDQASKLMRAKFGSPVLLVTDSLRLKDILLTRENWQEVDGWVLYTYTVEGDEYLDGIYSLKSEWVGLCGMHPEIVDPYLHNAERLREKSCHRYLMRTGGTKDRGITIAVSDCRKCAICADYPSCPCHYSETLSAESGRTFRIMQESVSPYVIPYEGLGEDLAYSVTCIADLYSGNRTNVVYLPSSADSSQLDPANETGWERMRCGMLRYAGKAE